MILYFAGSESKYHSTILKEHGVQSILESAFYLRFKKEPKAKMFQNHLLDSGGFTFRKHGKKADVVAYADYLNQFNVKRAFNMDMNSIEETAANQKYLEENTRAEILPIYHYSDWVNPETRPLLNEWADKYPYLSVAALGSSSTTQRALFYEFCFSVVRNRSRIHGLGVTVIDHCLNFPFYSVDSTTWLCASRFGDLFEFKGNTIVKHKSARHAANGTKKITNIEMLTFEGREFLSRGIKAMLEFEKCATKLWTTRGVTYD
jgi:hypothetical protein